MLRQRHINYKVFNFLTSKWSFLFLIGRVDSYLVVTERTQYCDRYLLVVLFEQIQEKSIYEYIALSRSFGIFRLNAYSFIFLCNYLMLIEYAVQIIQDLLVYYLTAGMDVGSPESGYDEVKDFLKDDDSTYQDDLHLDFIVNKDIAEDYIYSDSPVNDKFHLDSSENEKRAIYPSLSSSFRYYDVPGSPSENIFSYLQSRFHHVTTDDRDIVGDPETFEIQYNGNLHHVDTEKLCSSYFHDSVF